MSSSSDREKIFNEIVETESKYIEHLKTLNELYIQPIQKKKFFEFKKDMTETVKNLAIISNFNGFLLTQLQKTDQDNVGKIFVTIIPFLKTYTAYYNHYTGATAQIREEKSKNKQFGEWLQKVEVAAKKEGKQPLLSYLIMPVQRIPRYSLLLRELMSKTSADHPDSEKLQQALNETKKVADYLNEQFKVQENQTRLLQIEKNVMNMHNFDKVTITAPHRKFIYEAEVTFDDIENCQVYLFTDLLLVCSKTSEEQRNQYMVQRNQVPQSRRKSKRLSTSTPMDQKTGPEYVIMFSIELSQDPVPSIQTFVDYEKRPNLLLLSTETESHVMITQDKESASEFAAAMLQALQKLVVNAGKDPEDKSNYAPVSYYKLPTDMVEYVIKKGDQPSAVLKSPRESFSAKSKESAVSEKESSPVDDDKQEDAQQTTTTEKQDTLQVPSVLGERKRAPLEVVKKTTIKTPRRKRTPNKSPVDALDQLTDSVTLPSEDKQFTVEVEEKEEETSSVPKAARFGGVALPGMGMALPGLGDALKRRAAKQEEAKQEAKQEETSSKPEPVPTEPEPVPVQEPVQENPTPVVTVEPVEETKIEEPPTLVVEKKVQAEDSATSSPSPSSPSTPQEGGRRRKKKQATKQKQKEEQEKLRKEEELRVQQEQEKLEKERIQAEQEEQERIRLQKEEDDRIAEKERQEKEEQERLEKERVEAERLQQEQKEAEQLRHQSEKEEADRLAKEQLEQQEADRIKRENEELERNRLEQEQLEEQEAEKLEQIRQQKEEADRKAEKERQEKEEQDRLENERLENERLQKEQEAAEQARLLKEREEKERLEAERLQREQEEKDRIQREKEREEQLKLQREKDEEARLQREKEEQEMASEAERQLLIKIEKERLEREEARRIEAEKLKEQRIAQKKLEYEREQARKAEEERLEKLRLQKEEEMRLEKERLERERIQQIKNEEDKIKLQSQLEEALINIKQLERKIKEESETSNNWIKESKKQGASLYQYQTLTKQLEQKIDEVNKATVRDEAANIQKIELLQKRLISTQDDINQYKEMVVQERETRDEIAKREAKVVEEIREIESKIDQERAEIATLQAERVRFNKSLADVSIDLAKHGNRLTGESSTKVELMKELADLQLSFEREKKLVSRLEDQLKKEKLEREELFDELQDAKQEYKSLGQENKKLYEEISFYNGQLTGHTKSRAAAASKYDLESQIYNLQRQVRDVEYKLERETQNQKMSLQQKRKLEHQLEEAREEVAELREESSLLHGSIVHAEKDVNSLGAKIDDHLTQQATLKREIEKLRNVEREYQTKISNAEFTVRRENREIESLKSQLRSTELRNNTSSTVV